MKKLIFLAVALMLVFSGYQISYADTYFSTFEIVEINNQDIILRDFGGNRYKIINDLKDYKVGDMIRYDSVRDILKKTPLAACCN